MKNKLYILNILFIFFIRFDSIISSNNNIKSLLSKIISDHKKKIISIYLIIYIINFIYLTKISNEIDSEIKSFFYKNEIKIENIVNQNYRILSVKENNNINNNNNNFYYFYIPLDEYFYKETKYKINKYKFLGLFGFGIKKFNNELNNFKAFKNSITNIKYCDISKDNYINDFIQNIKTCLICKLHIELNRDLKDLKKVQ